LASTAEAQAIVAATMRSCPSNEVSITETTCMSYSPSPPLPI
jgi:hypothetical protein